MAGARPGGVTLVSILAWVSGLLQLIGGILVLFTPAAATATATAIAVAAWITIILGIITIAVGLGLWRGIPIARIIATVVFALNLINAIVGMFTAPANVWSYAISAILALIGLALLWTKAATAFFRR